MPMARTIQADRKDRSCARQSFKIGATADDESALQDAGTDRRRGADAAAARAAALHSRGLRERRAICTRARCAHLQSRQQWFGDDGDWQPPSDDAAVDLTGERIGPYRIVRSLGHGGMGEVFLAERADEQFQQQVAIKLVRRGLLSRHVAGPAALGTPDPRLARPSEHRAAVRRRHDHRRHALHRHGVRRRRADRHLLRFAPALTIEQRLRAVPDRLLGGAPRAPEPDRASRPEAVEHPGHARRRRRSCSTSASPRCSTTAHMMHTMAVTQADTRVMTPDHASPEQIRGEPITTASDIYVLGVVLYELLMRLQAVRAARAVASASSSARSARTRHRRPASRSQARERPAHAGTRSRSALARAPARLRRELRGDLDNIVLMAMRKEAERRYSSVEQFAADVQRYLDGMPVLARADAWSYRAGKFVRRHALAVSLARRSSRCCVGFRSRRTCSRSASHTSATSRRQTSARRRPTRTRAEAVQDFLIDSFRLADPSQARGKEITAREILDSGAARITRELTRQPDLQATLLDTIGSVYLSLELPERRATADRAGAGRSSRAVRRAAAWTSHAACTASIACTRRRATSKTAEALAIDSLAINTRAHGHAKPGDCREPVPARRDRIRQG